MPTSSTSRSRLPAPRNRIANPPRCYACSWLRDVCSQVEDALEYLERVRTHVDTPQIYASFLEVMHNQKSDTLEWIIIVLISAEICIGLCDLFNIRPV